MGRQLLINKSIYEQGGVIPLVYLIQQTFLSKGT
jgi:hypothetical protein